MSIVSDLKANIDIDITLKDDPNTIGPEHVGGRMKDVLAATLNPVNSIIMYHPSNLTEFDSSGLGIADNVIGWAICNGSNGTPDLRGRFIVGYDNRSTDPGNGVWDIDYNTIGETGGAKGVTLTIDQIPAHHHTIPWYNGAGGADGNTGNLVNGTGNTSDVGGGQAHENRPPYYVLVFIKRIN